MTDETLLKSLGWGFLGAFGFGTALYFGNQLVQKGRTDPNWASSWENLKQFCRENSKEIIATSFALVGGWFAIHELSEVNNPIRQLKDNPIHRIWKQLEKDTPESQQILGMSLDNQQYYVLRKYRNYHVLTKSPELQSAVQNLIERGVKPPPNPQETLIGLCDDNEDLIYWLESGNELKGWKHIKIKHINEKEFEKAFGQRFKREILIHWLFKTIIYGKPYRNVQNFLSYILEVNERSDKIIVAAEGNNGYIVSFHVDERKYKDAKGFENWRDKITWQKH